MFDNSKSFSLTKNKGRFPIWLVLYILIYWLIILSSIVASTVLPDAFIRQPIFLDYGPLQISFDYLMVLAAAILIGWALSTGNKKIMVSFIILVSIPLVILLWIALDKGLIQLVVYYLLALLAVVLISWIFARSKRMFMAIFMAIYTAVLVFIMIAIMLSYYGSYLRYIKEEFFIGPVHHSAYSAWISFIFLMTSALVIIVAGFLSIGKKYPLIRVNAFLRYIFNDSTVAIILGNLGMLALILYPEMEIRGWMGEKPIEAFHFWLGVLTFVGLWATPVIKGLCEYPKVFNSIFQQYIERRVVKARGHKIFAGFGHLGNIVFLDLLRARTLLISEKVVFPDYVIRNVIRDILIIEKDPSLFYLTFQTPSGDTFGVIKRSYPLLGMDNPRNSDMQDIYLIGILGDASRQDTLEKAHFKQAEDIICTIPNIEASFAAFDLQNEISRGETNE